ncbi:dTDP-4-dehydrorhamnose reductase (plasmid) [Pedobacter sp. BS3]|nr:dTDP-4-dehydrorhamnose reductase [Pedobacter sp. BS3]
MSKVIVFGAGGQLGQCLQLVSQNSKSTGLEWYFPAEIEANILEPDLLNALFKAYNPDFCINCAAYTAVDKAEDDVDTARLINKTGAENLARLCGKYGATLVHISTDFVFEGNSGRILSETDKAKPVNIYGLTKLEGEQAVAAFAGKYYIIRTSWLYSEYGNNFVKTMLRLGREKDSLNVIADQIGTPTYAVDLAACIVQIMQSGVRGYGVYHYSNEGVTSWYDFAKAIFDLAEINIPVSPVTTDQYVTRAVRPAFSVMDKSKIKEVFCLTIPYWRDSLKICIQHLQASNNLVS